MQELLRRVECFKSLDDASLQVLAENMRRASYQKGDTLCREGEPGGWMFIIDEGEVAVLKNTEAGVPVYVSTLRRGDYGGLISMFEAKDTPRTATLVARTPVTMWVIGHEPLLSLARTNPGVAMELLRYLSARVRRDNSNLARTLQRVYSGGIPEIYEECSPEERLILDSINHKIASAATLEEILDFLFDSFRQIGPCDRLSLSFLQEDGNRVVTRYVRADYEPVWLRPGFGQDLRGSTLDTVLLSGKPRVINDLEVHLSTHPDSRPTQMLLREGMRSSMSCPLIVEGRPVGFLFRTARQRNAFDEHQGRLHIATAERMSQAAEKAYQIQRLKEANNAYTEMLGFVSHELKSPLGAIVMNANLLRDGYLGPLTDKQLEKVSSIADKSRYLLELVGEYLDLAHIESGELDPRFKQDVDFDQEILQPALETVREHMEDKAMRFVSTIPDTLPVECAPDLLRIVVVNLLSNAAKYGNPGTEIRLAASLDAGKFRVSVWNEGPGFAERDRSKLFRKFSRVPSPELMKQKGTGVGLYTSWRIIQAHYGKIRAQSEPGDWAEFIFEIPQPLASGLREGARAPSVPEGVG